MCLKINSESFSEDTFKTAEEDVVCYKLYIKIIDEVGWKSPYKRILAPQLGILRQATENFNSSGIFVDEDMQTLAGIHSYAEIGSILAMIIKTGNKLFKVGPEWHVQTRVVKSIIPKGTKYLEGTSSFGRSYSSEYLIDKEVLVQLEFPDQEVVLSNLKKLFNLAKEIE